MDSRFFGKLKRINVRELAKICGFTLAGAERDFEISEITTLSEAGETDLTFFGNKKYRDEFKNSKAGAIVIGEKDVKDLPQNSVGLVCKNVMIGYAHALDILCQPETHLSHICASACIHESAKIGRDCFIGEGVVIEENVEIGDNSVIGHHSVIQKGCVIGRDARVGNNVSISHSLIGKSAIINSGARIGESGFGIIPSASGMVYVKQIGRVIIGDRVRIGANTTIDRGSVADTKIGNDTIIDNLVQIGHNVTIGDRSIIVAQVGIAGSAKIGNGVVLAGQVGVAGHLEIGDGVMAAAKSGIASSVNAGEIIGGIPAVEAHTWKRQVAFLRSAVMKKHTEEKGQE